ncbi:MAG: hypothetical protein IPM46_09285 [Flavobacteriales bacterium]|nr:hypothetical protein [Flavobacteriales bacterium]
MRQPKCKPFLPAAKYPRKAVRSVHYDGTDLSIEIQGEGFAFARVVFSNPAGFRVLDESDLAEFWNTYSEPNGWLYEVEEGGWFELESNRPAFNSSTFLDGIHEYLVVDEICISVLCLQPPEIKNTGADLV